MSHVASLIFLPTAAPKPVEQRRRGRLPRAVARLAEYRNSVLDKAGSQALIDEARILESGAQQLEAVARKVRAEALELRKRAERRYIDEINHDG